MEILKEKITKIAIFQTAFLGDVLLILPVIHHLKKSNPSLIIDLIVNKGMEEIKNFLPEYINEVIIFDKKKNKCRNSIAIVNKLKNYNYDLIISPHRSARTSLIVFFSKAKYSIGFDKAKLSFLYSEQKTYNSNQHEIERNLSLINDLVKVTNWKEKIKVTIKNINFGAEFEIWRDKKEIIVAIATGSAWQTKKYPDNYFKSIIERLISHKIKIVLIGGKQERENSRELIEFSKFKSEIINFIGKLNFYESLCLIDKCNLLISNDSAPTHLGTLTNSKILTIYGSTIPEFGFYPFRKKDSIIQTENLYCKPCGIHGKNNCKENHFKCMMDLKPEIVFNKIKNILNL